MSGQPFRGLERFQFQPCAKRKTAERCLNPDNYGINLNDHTEDYTESVCLLLPKGRATLVDLDFFEWASEKKWSVRGRTISFQRYWAGTKAVRLRTSTTFLHRAALFFQLDAKDVSDLSYLLRNREIDHANRNPWDNRRKNLRPATRSENMMNRPGLPNTSSRFKGVYCNPGKRKVTWSASVTIQGKTYRLGTFDDEVQAAIAYNEFVADRCGEFAYLNPIVALPTDPPCVRMSRKRFAKVNRTPEPPVTTQQPNDWRAALGESLQAAKMAAEKKTR